MVVTDSDLDFPDFVEWIFMGGVTTFKSTIWVSKFWFGGCILRDVKIILRRNVRLEFG